MVDYNLPKLPKFSVKFCGNCHYFGQSTTYRSENGKHECHVNPPVITEDDEGIYSRYPVVDSGAIACRFFEKRGA